MNGKIPEALTREEVERMMASTQGPEPITLRNRAILELFDAAGLRVSELTGLRVGDVDPAERTLRCLGKGSKERMVPIHRSAARAVTRYLDIRGKLYRRDPGDRLFVSRQGRGLTRQQVGGMLRKLARKAGITRRVHCHLFRSTCATRLAEGGMNLVELKDFLGHADISATEPYLAPANLQALKQTIHLNHPRG